MSSSRDMLETNNWGIRYVVVDTRNWWLGQHVLLSPYAVKTVNWSDREAAVDISRSQVKASPPWSPSDIIHYGWPRYGR